METLVKEFEGKTHGVKKQIQVLKVGTFWSIGTAQLLGIFTIHI